MSLVNIVCSRQFKARRTTASRRKRKEKKRCQTRASNYADNTTDGARTRAVFGIVAPAERRLPSASATRVRNRARLTFAECIRPLADTPARARASSRRQPACDQKRDPRSRACASCERRDTSDDRRPLRCAQTGAQTGAQADDACERQFTLAFAHPVAIAAAAADQTIASAQ